MADSTYPRDGTLTAPHVLEFNYTRTVGPVTGRPGGSVEVPIELESIVLRCLEKWPEERYQTVEELEAALRAVPLEQTWNLDRAREWWTLHSDVIRPVLYDSAPGRGAPAAPGA